MIVNKEDQKIYSDEAYKRKVAAKIKDLQKKRNAIILAHNYQRDEIQEIADIRGDSLALARAAKDIQQDTIGYSLNMNKRMIRRRIAFIIFMRAKLQRIHKNAYHNNIALPSCATHETQVSLMKISHGRD